MTPKQIIEAIKAERPEINTLFFVGCGASSAEQYPAQYFMDCNARKIRTSFYTANEFNYATPVSLDETAIVIACSLGGTTPETVAAAKLSQEKGAKVIAVTHDGNSPLAKNADYVIVHGFEKDYAAKLEKMNNILMLAVEVLNQYEGYDHYEDMVKGSENIYAAIEDAVSYSLTPAKAFAEAGMNAEQICKKLEEEALESSIYVTVTTLKYLKKGGRITPAAAAIGTVLNLKPVLQIQGEKLDAYAKVRGKKQAKRIMMKAMQEDWNTRFKQYVESGEMCLQIAYAGNKEEAEEFKKEVEAAFPGMDIHMDPLSLSVACHIGHGALAVACSKKVTV